MSKIRLMALAGVAALGLGVAACGGNDNSSSNKSAGSGGNTAKLEAAMPGWRFIHTHFGFGYRFQPEPSHLFHKTATSR